MLTEDGIFVSIPYKGFNSSESARQYNICTEESQSPYKGFNRILFYNEQYIKTDESINPPIRGSIEQDNALFENYNHKR